MLLAFNDDKPLPLPVKTPVLAVILAAMILPFEILTSLKTTVLLTTIECNIIT
jgi:hypothetical protein